MNFSARVRSLTFRLLSILLAAFLVWFSLRGVDLATFAESMRSAQYEWIFPVIGITLLSHWVRAYRWHVLVTAIPEDSGSRVSVLDLFASVMIGYMVNYALPRVGEVARCTYLSTKRKISFSALLGTVAVERIADMLVLGLGLLVTTLLLRGDLQSLWDELAWPDLPWEWITAGGILIVLMLCLVLRSEVSAPLRIRLRILSTKFVGGIKTIYLTPRRWQLIWTTAIMWLMYGLMAYIPLLMFDLQATRDLLYWDGLAIMFIGVLGLLVPTPGGAGSFHVITILTLTAVYGIPQPGAAAYAVFIHGAQLILYLLVGVLILVFRPSKLVTQHASPE